MRTCSGCGETKHLDDFGNLRAVKSGKFRRCRQCQSAAKVAWRAANLERSNRTREEWYAKNARVLRSKTLQKKFGITADQFDELLHQQGGGCAICGVEVNLPDKHGVPRRLAVDHCHETGMVRGLLCTPCNLGLGYFADNVDRLAVAMDYLKAAEAVHA